MAFRLWGSMEVLMTLRRSYPMESGVDRDGTYLMGFVLKVEDILMTLECLR